MTGFGKCAGIVGMALLASALFTTSPAAADEREALARQLTEQIGVTELASTMMVAMAPLMREQIRASVPQLTETQLDEVVAIMMVEFHAAESELTDMIVDLYASEFTEAELVQFIAFYQTDLGQIMLDRMPGLAERSVEMGQAWGAQVALRAMPQVQEYFAGLE
ncbi:DUF2059 domain-containing protein [Maricaulis sp.]|uniref:DUF2059 domain-containing protein n=2 Tax=Maricaulis sp. TaxID=1486257 RepID=UPI003A90A6A0